MDDRYQRIADLFGLTLPSAPADGPSALGRKSTGDTADESAELGRQWLNDGDYERAIGHFRQAIEQSKGEDIKVRIDLAGAYEYAEMAPQAMLQYLEALRHQAEAPEPHVGLSQIYKREGRWKESIAELEAALRLNPDSGFHHYKLAELYVEIGERERALSAIRAAVSMEPADSFYHYWMGDLLISMKRYDEAIDALRAAIELSPGDDFLFLRTAIAFWGAERKTESVKAVRLASDLDPDQALYHGLLRLFLTALGLREEAEQEARRALELDRYDEERLRRLAAEVGLEA